jgi:hypothetical protein
MADSDDQTDQFKALDVADGFRAHDQAALARLTAAARAEQRRIREQLWRYTDEIWNHVKAHSGVEAPADDPSFSAVAGLRDLTSDLCRSAEQASADAGDEPGG